MKFFLVLLFSFSVEANPLYDWTHDKLIEVFNMEYRDDISFGQVYYLENFDCVDKTLIPIGDNTIAVFNTIYQKEYNDIWMLKNPSAKFDGLDEIYMQSSMVHEFAHFFTKKAGFNEEFDGINKFYHRGMLEAIAHFIENLWLQETTGSGLSSYSLNMEEENFVIERSFFYLASDMYRHDIGNFLFNAIDYFKEDASEKFKKTVTERDYSEEYKSSPPINDSPRKSPGEAFDACL